MLALVRFQIMKMNVLASLSSSFLETKPIVGPCCLMWWDLHSPVSMSWLLPYVSNLVGVDVLGLRSLSDSVSYELRMSPLVSVCNLLRGGVEKGTVRGKGPRQASALFLLFRFMEVLLPVFSVWGFVLCYWFPGAPSRCPSQSWCPHLRRPPGPRIPDSWAVPAGAGVVGVLVPETLGGQLWWFLLF